MNACTLAQARAAKSKATALFSALAPVVGVGLTRVGDGYGLKVNLERAPIKPLPPDVDGVPVRVEIVGRIGKRQTPG
jgi:hypothetical protein